MNKNIKLLVESIFDDNADLFDPEKEYMDDMYDIIRDNLYKYHPENKKDLQSIIQHLFNRKIYDLNCIDVSQITNFSQLFFEFRNHENINFDVSNWNVGNGNDFRGMFYDCKQFNCDLSGWNVGNGTDFNCMFAGCKQFNCDLSGWNVGKGRIFLGMFYGCENFNQDLSKWDVSNGINFSWMFDGCKSNKIMPRLKKIKYTINF